MNNEKKKKIKFEIKRVYVGEIPIGEVFEGVIEHIAMKNLENTKEDKQTQAWWMIEYAGVFWYNNHIEIVLLKERSVKLNRTKKYIAALYCRLSKDDGSANERMSIYSQKAMLKQYAEQNDIAIYDYYVDDGYSGTNFERPAFKKMITDIENGKINCVITKDLSRLGRNYLESGAYIGMYFPQKM